MKTGVQVPFLTSVPMSMPSVSLLKRRGICRVSFDLNLNGVAKSPNSVFVVLSSKKFYL
jgi:hypothetical protein